VIRAERGGLTLIGSPAARGLRGWGIQRGRSSVRRFVLGTTITEMMCVLAIVQQHCTVTKTFACEDDD
jgi:hypothetical protein